MKMDRYECNGWLNICINDEYPDEARVLITHHRSHQCYTNITISEDVEKLVADHRDMTASQVSQKTILESSF